MALELRDFVLEEAPEVAEKVAFDALCYYKAEAAIRCDRGGTSASSEYAATACAWASFTERFCPIRSTC